MKICIVYNPKDSKLYGNPYCTVFRDMLFALAKEYDCKQYVTQSIDASHITADMIFFFDPHATHHVRLYGVEKHPAIKVELWNDINKDEFMGTHPKIGFIHKLGMKERAERAKERGTKYIVTSAKYKFLEIYEKYFGSDVEKMLVYFPHAPDKARLFDKPLSERQPLVIGNGAVHGDLDGGYKLRRWAFEQPDISVIPHTLYNNKKTPMGNDYTKFLSFFAGVLALNGAFPVPKYMEAPFAGCLTFAEYHKEYEELGFKDLESCVYVKEENFNNRVRDFLNDIPSYQKIAVNGYNLVKDNYTSQHFAKAIGNLV